MNEKQRKPFYKRWWFIAIVVVVLIAAIGGGGGEDESQGVTQEESEQTMPFTVEEYTQRLKEAVEETDDSNIALKDENIVINEEEERKEGDPLASYMFKNNTGILYKEDGMYLVLSDADTATIGNSVYNLARIFIGTVDDSLSMGDRQKTLQSLDFNTEPISPNENEVISTTQTDNYKFTYMYSGEDNTRVIKAESLN